MEENMEEIKAAHARVRKMAGKELDEIERKHSDATLAADLEYRRAIGPARDRFDAIMDRADQKYWGARDRILGKARKDAPPVDKRASDAARNLAAMEERIKRLERDVEPAQRIAAALRPAPRPGDDDWSMHSSLDDE